MSGFVAIASTTRDSRVTEEEIGEMAAAYVAIRGDGTRHVARVDDRVRLVKIDTGRSLRPGIEERGRSWAAATGAPHGAKSLIAARPEDLDGQFALVAYDDAIDRLSIASDPFGFHSIYVAERPDRVYVSSSALALARYLHAPPSRVDMLSFLRSGYQFGRPTQWEGVERLDPAQEWIVFDDRVERRTYWRPEVDPRVWSLSFDAAVDHCAGAATAAISANLSDSAPAWSDLTGGYDSRALNLLLDRAGIDFGTTTRDTPQVEDIEIAEELARAAGWEWFHTRLPDDWHEQVVDEMRVALGWADGHLEVLQLARVLWPHKVLAESRPTLLSSGGGEHFQYAGWKSEFLRAGRSNNLHMDNFIGMVMLRPSNTSVFKTDPTAMVKDDFRRRLRAYAAPYADELNTVQGDLLYAYKSMGHFGAYAASDAAYLTAQIPFYFKDVFSAAFSTNFRYRNAHKLFRHLMYRLDPKLATMRTSRGGPAIPQRVTNVHLFWPYYATLARKAINKISHKVTGKTFLAAPPPTWAWEDKANSSVLDHLGRDEPFRHENMRSGDLYNAKRLDEFIAASRVPGFTETPMLGRIITLELALRAVDQSL